jgi:uncharacterized protein (DUF1501 family)
LQKGSGAGERRLALAVGGHVPLLLRGNMPVATWEPPDMKPAAPEFILALARLYENDPLLGPALKDGLRAQNVAAEILGDAADGGGTMGKAGNGRGFGPGSFRPLAEAAGKMLAAADGPRIAVLEMGGWDTHAGQGAETGRLAQNLAGLAEGLDALAKALGPDAWRRTVVVAMTEFGRTVAPNGSNGTDHGTSLPFLIAGPQVRGGVFYGARPDLSDLVDGNLKPSVSMETLYGSIISDVLGTDPAPIIGQTISPIRLLR